MTSLLITGAGRGIGLAITRHLSERGWDVYATARSSDDLRDLANLRHVHAIALDITDRAAVARLHEQSTEGREDRRSRSHVPTPEASLPVRQRQPRPTCTCVGDPDSRHRRTVRWRHNILRSSP